MRQTVNQDGYTIIELLVVIGIVAIIASLATPLASSVVHATNARSDSYLLMSGLRRLQTEAVLSGETITLSLSSTLNADLAGRGIVLSDSASVELKQPLSYYADGTASGGRLVLHNGERETTIAVAWLTGTPSREAP